MRCVTDGPVRCVTTIDRATGTSGRRTSAMASNCADQTPDATTTVSAASSSPSASRARQCPASRRSPTTLACVRMSAPSRAADAANAGAARRGFAPPSEGMYSAPRTDRPSSGSNARAWSPVISSASIPASCSSACFLRNDSSSAGVSATMSPPPWCTSRSAPSSCSTVPQVAIESRFTGIASAYCAAMRLPCSIMRNSSWKCRLPAFWPEAPRFSSPFSTRVTRAPPRAR